MNRMLLLAAVLVLSACTAISGSSGTDDGLTIDRDVFAYDEDEGFSYETFVVSGATDQAKVITALQRVATRFMMVDANGLEHLDDASYEAAADAGIYTPNYVSDPSVTKDGVQLYVDCKGAIEEPMAQTFRKILREELVSAGIRGRVRIVTF